MHETAFHEWGAVPAEILYDRMRTIWTGTDERGEIIWNAVFLILRTTGVSHRGSAVLTGRRPKAKWNRE
jgi:hypothetical protein